MSLIRPEACLLIQRWTEPAIYAGAAALGVALALKGLRLGTWLPVGLGIGIVVLAALAALAWWRRTRFSGTLSAEGLVEIDERRVGYLGPEGGGFVDLDGLTRLELLTPGTPGDAVWILSHDAGSPLRIPVGATGAERLIDVFSGLPGMRIDLALDTIAARRAARALIWSRALR